MWHCDTHGSWEELLGTEVPGKETNQAQVRAGRAAHTRTSHAFPRVGFTHGSRGEEQGGGWHRGPL